LTKVKHLPGHLFITGLSSGLGAQVLQQAIAAGYKVTGVVRTPLQKTSLLAQYPEHLNLLVADLRDSSAVNALADSLRAEVFTHLLFNAGYAEMGKLHELSQQSIRDMLEVNLLSHILLLHSLLPSCLKNDTKVCFVGSLAAHIPGPRYASYSMAKAALGALAGSLAMEYPQLRTLCIELGGVATPFHAKAQSGFNMQKFRPLRETGRRLFNAVLHEEGVATLYAQWTALRWLAIHGRSAWIALGRRWYAH
jgi:uncharacterized protein